MATLKELAADLLAMVGPRSPVGPQRTRVPADAVVLNPGDSIQQAVNSHAAGTTFYLTEGVYDRQHIVPKDGNKFIGAQGAILDGQDSTVRAFDGDAADVTIRNLTIRNYAAGFQDAPIYAVDGVGWKLAANNIHHNAGIGVLFRDDFRMLRNNIHHNHEMGFGSDGGEGIRIKDNEIAFNNYLDEFGGNEDGGCKLWDTDGAVLKFNYSHDNHGPGFWDDFNNNDITYAFNRVENNYAMGIYHEIGYNASIHDNWVVGNGIPNDLWAQGWLWNAGIQIAASGGVNGGKVEIFDNYVESTRTGNGIGLIQQDRTNNEAELGPWVVQDVLVHDNTINLSAGGAVGGVQDLGDNRMFSAAAGNTFFDNTYVLGSNTSDPFWWANDTGGVSFWQGKGHEAGSP